MRSAIFILLTITPTAWAGGNWPEFRGPGGDGHAEAENLPLEWGEGKNVRWKVAIEGKAWSSPVVWGGAIWMTNATSDGRRLSVVCVDRESGNIQRDVLVFEVAEPFFCHNFNSYASPTPVIEEGRLYAHYGSAGTACVDTTTGKVLWRRSDFPCDHHRAAGSSPILVGNHLILTFDGVDLQYLVALDRSTGETVWKKDRETAFQKPDPDWHKAYATPMGITLGDEIHLIAPAAQATSSLDPKTGRENWRVEHGGMNSACRPIWAGGRLYITDGYGGKGLLAVRPGSKSSEIEWTHRRGVPTRSSPIVVGNHIYMVNDRGVLTVVGTESGEQVSRLRLGGNFSASPIYGDGKLYYANQEGATYVVDPAGESTKILATNALEEGCMASPAALGDVLFLRTRTHLYAIGR